MKSFSIWLAAIALVFFTACGGGGGGSSTPDTDNSGDTNTQTPVNTTPSQKGAAAAAMLLNQGLVEGLVNSMGDLSTITGAPNLRAALSQPCLSSGTMEMSYAADYSSISATFNSCNNGTGSVMDGTLSISGLSSNAPTYVFDGMTINDGETLTYMDVTVNATVLNSGNTLVSYDVTLSGTMRVTEDGDTSEIVFSNYHASMQNSAVSVEGQMTISMTPDPCGVNGTYIITTNQPITYDAAGNITGGEIVINGDTYTYNPDGTVTVNGVETIDLDDLENCDT